MCGGSTKRGVVSSACDYIFFLILAAMTSGLGFYWSQMPGLLHNLQKRTLFRVYIKAAFRMQHYLFTHVDTHAHTHTHTEDTDTDTGTRTHTHTHAHTHAEKDM